ncbi:MAG: WD40 repeat domain-containing protein [Bacteroidota bacterium]|nr:WD40 repeat domain-containing protein [Bacteroidota bacterium]
MSKYKIDKTAQLTGHTGSVYGLCNGPSPMVFFSGSSDGVVAEWNIENTDQAKIAVKIDSAVYSIAFIKENNLLLIGNANGGIHIVDYIEKKEIKLLQLHTAQVFDIKYSEKNKCFYSASSDGTIAVTNIADFNSEGLKLCQQKARQLNLNPDESLLAVACGDCTIRIISTSTFNEIKTFAAHDLSANSVCFHPSGKLLISGGRDAILNVWDLEQDYKLKLSIPAHNFAIYSIEFSLDGKLMATASRDKTVKLWDSATFDLIKRLDNKSSKGHLNSVNRLIWNKQSGNLITSGDDRSIILWQISE